MCARHGVRAVVGTVLFLIASLGGTAAVIGDEGPFPRGLVEWTPIADGPVFQGAGGDAWDRKIRERGAILEQGGTYTLWYTGYNDDRSPSKSLGRATSDDGLRWRRDPANPIFDRSWVEDVCVVRDGKDGLFLMFAEGKGDIAHQLTSPDGRRWDDLGSLDIRNVDGSPIAPGPYGTPTAWFEDGTWSLFYERGDQGVWVARSNDRRVWTNVRDTPVLAMGPEPYDRNAVALNQVIKRDGVYYAFYHANAHKPWKDWTSNIARSRDLVHWEKYPGNPIVANNCSSPILVSTPQGDRLYTMHPEVRVFVNPKPAAGEEFELSVVGPGGKPIAGAVAEIRSTPAVPAGAVRRGKLVEEGRGGYGAMVAADDGGRLAVDLPRPPTRFDVFLTLPGYGPYWAGWSSETHDQPIPRRFTAELDGAWSVGGIVVDEEGKAIEGATVHPSIEFKKPPGVTLQLGTGTTLETDAAGKWRFDSVPVAMGEVHVNVDHPGFRPLRRSLTRGEFGIEGGRGPVAGIVLDRGVTVTGKVTDDSGRPIAGALVRTKFLNDIRQAKTGPDGAYTLAGCEPRGARVVVSAKGRATDMKELNIEPGMGPVDFAMKPGGTVRIRVLDEQGNPVPKARIFFQRWRGRFAYFEFDHVSQYADKEGVWVWNEAPLDEFAADICPPGGMQLSQQPLIARAEEYVFRLPAMLVVSGKVVDASTKEPIPAFRVIPGIRSSETHMNWVRQVGSPGTELEFAL